MAELIWVYAEVVEGRITPTTLEILSKAADVGTTEAILLGPAPDDAVKTLGTYGASKIYRSPDAVFHSYLTLPAVKTIAGLIESHRPDLMLFASSYVGRDLAAALSVILDSGAITDVSEFVLKDGEV